MHRVSVIAALFLTILVATPVWAAHRVLLQGNDRLAILDAQGQLEWEMKWGGIHDLHVLPSGHILVQQDMQKVVEIDPRSKQIIWSYDASQANGNAGQRVEVHAFQPLANGHILIAESGPARLIEVDRDGQVIKQLPLVVEHRDPHTDTRLVRELSNGNYLVCHEADGTAREYDGQAGNVVWEYKVPLFGQAERPGHGPEAFGNRLFCALRLKNGHTLITTGNGHSVLEVTPEQQIVWQLHQHDLPGITLAWVTTLEVLPNGHFVIGNCHAGPGQPLLIEIDPATKQVVWTLDKFDQFGNSVSNSQLLDVDGPVLR